MQSKINYRDSLKPENKLELTDNRRFRERGAVPQQHPSENPSNFTNCKQFEFKNREFRVGQWIDAKDTIDQWLEAQVLRLRENAVFIHYNGWGERWDEWIDKDSPRLAVFRSHTVQNPKSNYLSPIPNIMPENTYVSLPFIEPTLSSTLDKVCELVTKSVGLLAEFKGIREHKTRMLNLEEEKHPDTGEEEKKEEEQSRAS
jgi:hypothetical protein